MQWHYSKEIEHKLVMKSYEDENHKKSPGLNPAKETGGP
jgi:hypothetical protein